MVSNDICCTVVQTSRPDIIRYEALALVACLCLHGMTKNVPPRGWVIEGLEGGRVCHLHVTVLINVLKSLFK